MIYSFLAPPPCTLCPCVHRVQGSQKKKKKKLPWDWWPGRIIKHHSSRNNTRRCTLWDAGCCYVHVCIHLYTPSPPPRLAAQANMHVEKFRPTWLATRCWCKIALRSVIPSLQNNEAKTLFWRLRQLERFLRHSPFCPLLSRFPLWGLSSPHDNWLQAH